jgi:hypothetical protein
MMAKMKSQEENETQEKPDPGQVEMEKPAPADKQGGPMRTPMVQRAAVTEKLADAEEGPGATGRARAAVQMQRAVGNSRLNRLMGADEKTGPDKEPSADPFEQEADRMATQVGSGPAVHRSVLRTSGPRIQRLRARGLVSRDLREIRRDMLRFRRQLDDLESERTITTEEAEDNRAKIDELLSEAEELVKHRQTTREDARRIWRRGRELMRIADGLQSRRRGLRRRAAAGRSTQGKRLVADFQIRPPVIRVHEGEAARISFVLREPAQSITWFILSDENREGTSHRFFNVANTGPGYKVAIWNGTFEGSRNQPPQSGTYRVHLWVTGRDGRTERLFDQIRVENPQDLVVHPRTGSGYALQSLRFDGSHAVLTDSNGNAIRMRAVSGLKPHHRLNPGRVDYTQSRHQWVKDRGPIPEGDYTIRQSSVQRPERERGALRYPRGATARAWGPYRVPLYPLQRGNREGFFVHLDVTNDGTAGCIGIHPGDEGKFNNMMSLLSLMDQDLPVTVSY